MADEDRTFSPTQAQANRARMQGGGVGQSEMNMQRDPTRFQESTRGERTEPFDTELQAGTGDDRGDLPEGADQYDFDGRDNPQEDGGPPSGGMHHGETHTKWGERVEAERGQGPKTRARNKEINSGQI